MPTGFSTRTNTGMAITTISTNTRTIRMRTSMRMGRNTPTNAVTTTTITTTRSSDGTYTRIGNDGAGAVDALTRPARCLVRIALDVAPA